jgi:hypothetical protein
VLTEIYEGILYFVQPVMKHYINQISVHVHVSTTLGYNEIMYIVYYFISLDFGCNNKNLMPPFRYFGSIIHLSLSFVQGNKRRSGSLLPHCNCKGRFFSLSSFSVNYFISSYVKLHNITWTIVCDSLLIAVCLPMDHKATKHNKRK